MIKMDLFVIYMISLSIKYINIYNIINMIIIYCSIIYYAHHF